MNNIRYLLILCVLIIFSLTPLRYIYNTYDKKFEQKVQIIEPVRPDGSIDEVLISKDILIDDHQEPIKVIQQPKVVKPYISAESYLVANLNTGEIYIDHNSNKVFPIASVSKLYTALVVHHLFDLDKKIIITESILEAYGDAGHLLLDEKFTPNELLYALLMESSNDAALAYAESFGYDQFMEQMNGFAQEIGMHSTYFKDPSGLSPQNISSAQDLLVLSKYLYRSEKDILEISRTKEIDLATTTDHDSHHFLNINPFSYYAEFIGGKTGRTNEAKEAMVSIFNKKIDNTEYPIVIIVLRSDLGEREINTEKLLGMFVDKVGGHI